MTGRATNQDIQNTSTAQKLEWIRVLLSSEVIGKPEKNIINILENAHSNQFNPHEEPFDSEEYKNLTNEQICILKEFSQLVSTELIDKYTEILSSKIYLEDKMIYRDGLNFLNAS